jgi:type IV secretory pathway VirB2 component (pilin)
MTCGTTPSRQIILSVDGKQIEVDSRPSDAIALAVRVKVPIYAEETVLARLNSAWGVFLSVAVSAIVGYVVLMALTWTIPNGDIAATALDPYPVLYIAYGNLSAFMANVVAVIVFGGMWLCGLSSISRATTFSL